MNSERNRPDNSNLTNPPDEAADAIESHQLQESQPPPRSPEYFDRYYRDLARRLDPTGRDYRFVKREVRNRQSVATLEITLDGSRQIAIIEPIFYENPEESAEQVQELVCTTDAKGEFTHQRLTRREAREQNERYLIVTALIFHNGKLIVQKRSSKKDIDPGQLSASAHGVAREIIYEFPHGGRSAEDYHSLSHETVSLLNTSLEIFEELYHDYNPDTCHPTIKIWRGTEEELASYVESYNIDEPDTVYLILKDYLPDDGYPLGDHRQKRSRGIAIGYIFSKNNPSFSFDPYEISAVEEYDPKELVNNPNVSEDLRRLLERYVQFH